MPPKMNNAVLLSCTVEVNFGSGIAPVKQQLTIRQDAAFFLVDEVIQRHIPVALIEALSIRNGGSTLHIKIFKEHDVVLVPVDDTPSLAIEAIVDALKNAHQPAGPLPSMVDGSAIDLASLELNAPMDGKFNSISQKVGLRRKGGTESEPSGPITLAIWDQVAGPVSPAISEAKIAPTLRKVLEGQHVVMMGNVYLRDATNSYTIVTPPGQTRSLVFTLTSYFLIDESQGVVINKKCIYHLESIKVDTQMGIIALCEGGPGGAITAISFPSDNLDKPNMVTDYTRIAQSMQAIIVREGYTVPLVNQPLAINKKNSNNNSNTSSTSAGKQEGGATNNNTQASTATNNNNNSSSSAPPAATESSEKPVAPNPQQDVAGSKLEQQNGSSGTAAAAASQKPSPSSFQTTEGQTRDQIRARLVRFYEVRAPEKLPGVDQAMAAYEDHYDEMIETLIGKYGAEPTAEEAPAAAAAANAHRGDAAAPDNSHTGELRQSDRKDTYMPAATATDSANDNDNRNGGAPPAATGAGSPNSSNNLAAQAAGSPVNNGSIYGQASRLDFSDMEPEELIATIPDYGKPYGDLGKMFANPRVLIARRIYRFTSKKNWEPRVLILQNNEKILIVDKKKEVRRAITMEQVSSIQIIQHWESNAIVLTVTGEHDLVMKHHEECPPTMRLTHIAALIQWFAPDVQIFREENKSKKKLKELMSARNLKKPENYLTPAKEVEMVKKNQTSPRTASFYKEGGSRGNTPRQSGLDASESGSPGRGVSFREIPVVQESESTPTSKNNRETQQQGASTTTAGGEAQSPGPNKQLSMEEPGSPDQSHELRRPPVGAETKAHDYQAGKVYTMEELKATVPDYQAPVGELCEQFITDRTLIARRMMRLTSKFHWELRVLMITTDGFVLICDDNQGVRRSLPASMISKCTMITHWEGTALRLEVQGQHQLIIASHRETRHDLTIVDVLNILKHFNPNMETESIVSDEGADGLKAIFKEGELKKQSSSNLTGGSPLGTRGRAKSEIRPGHSLDKVMAGEDSEVKPDEATTNFDATINNSADNSGANDAAVVAAAAGAEEQATAAETQQEQPKKDEAKAPEAPAATTTDGAEPPATEVAPTKTKESEAAPEPVPEEQPAAATSRDLPVEQSVAEPEQKQQETAAVTEPQPITADGAEPAPEEVPEAVAEEEQLAPASAVRKEEEEPTANTTTSAAAADAESVDSSSLPPKEEAAKTYHERQEERPEPVEQPKQKLVEPAAAPPAEEKEEEQKSRGLPGLNLAPAHQIKQEELNDENNSSATQETPRETPRKENDQNASAPPAATNVTATPQAQKTSAASRSLAGGAVPEPGPTPRGRPYMTFRFKFGREIFAMYALDDFVRILTKRREECGDTIGSHYTSPDKNSAPRDKRLICLYVPTAAASSSTPTSGGNDGGLQVPQAMTLPENLDEVVMVSSSLKAFIAAASEAESLGLLRASSLLLRSPDFMWVECKATDFLAKLQQGVSPATQAENMLEEEEK